MIKIFVCDWFKIHFFLFWFELLMKYWVYESMIILSFPFRWEETDILPEQSFAV